MYSQIMHIFQIFSTVIHLGLDEYQPSFRKLIILQTNLKLNMTRASTDKWHNRFLAETSTLGYYSVFIKCTQDFYATTATYVVHVKPEYDYKR